MAEDTVKQQEIGEEEHRKAAQVFFEKVQWPAFSNRLAQHNILPRTEEDASYLLKMGRQLLVLEQAGALEPEATSEIKTAAAELDAVFQKIAAPAKQQYDFDQLTKAALGDSDIAASAKVLAG